MKLILLTIFFTPLLSVSQSSRKELDNPGRLKTTTLNLSAKKIAPPEVKLQFSKIKIIDERFDTTKIGFAYKGNFFQPKINSFKKMVLKNGTATSIQEYYTEYYQNSFLDNGFELLIIIKKFWFSVLGAKKKQRY